MDRKFVGQAHYEEIFATSAGWVVVAAEVESFGRTLRLSNIAVEPLETTILKPGAGDVLSIRSAVEAAARQEGYTRIEISGVRISGASPNRPIFIRRSLA